MNTGRTLLVIAALLFPASVGAAPLTMELAQATGVAPPAPGQPGGPPAGLPPPPFAGPPPLPQPPALPPPLPSQSIAQFFYSEAGRPAGPFSLADLRAKVAAGAITAATLVWKAGTVDWVAAKDQPEVASLLAAPTLPPAVGTVPAIDPNAYLLGTWQSDDEGPSGTIGPARLTLAFAKGGGLSGTFAFSMGGSAARTSLPVTGFWAATATGARRTQLALILLIQNGAQVQTMSTTAVLDIVDNNTMRDVADGSLTTRVTQ